VVVGGLFVVLRDAILSRVVKWFFFPLSPSRFSRFFASLSLPSFPPSLLSSSLKFALEKERKRLKN